MPSDPSALLETTTGATAGLVAIIGGMLVSRYIGLESEQQGAQRSLKALHARLMAARERADKAREELVTQEHDSLVKDEEVRNAIFKSTTISEMMSHLVFNHENTRFGSGRDLFGFMSQIHAEISHAKSILEETLSASADSGDSQFQSWQLLFNNLKRVTSDGDPRFEWIWEKCVTIARTEMLAKDKAFSVGVGRFVIHKHPDAVSSETFQKIDAARRQEELVSAWERATQKVEDLQLEYSHLKQVRDAVVKPSTQFWVGLTVLCYPTVVSIGYPVWIMSKSVSEIENHATRVMYLFFSSLLVLIGYFFYIGIRLLRKRQ